MALNHVLLDAFALEGPNGFGPGLAPRAGRTLVSDLRTISGATVYPLYFLPQAANPNYQGNDIGVVSCSVMRQLAVLGQCAAGLAAVQVNDQDLVYSDNPHQSTRRSSARPIPPSPAASPRCHCRRSWSG